MIYVYPNVNLDKLSILPMPHVELRLWYFRTIRTQGKVLEGHSPQLVDYGDGYTEIPEKQSEKDPIEKHNLDLMFNFLLLLVGGFCCCA